MACRSILCVRRGLPERLYSNQIFLGHSGGNIPLHHLTGLSDRGLHLHTRPRSNWNLHRHRRKDGAVPLCPGVPENHSRRVVFPVPPFPETAIVKLKVLPHPSRRGMLRLPLIESCHGLGKHRIRVREKRGPQ